MPDTAHAIRGKKSSYDLVQFKRMIGKGLVKPWSGLTINKKTIGEKIAAAREKILSAKQKFRSVCMSAALNDGILHVFRTYEYLLAIDSIPYSVIKKNNITLTINMQQYCKLTKQQIATLLK